MRFNVRFLMFYVMPCLAIAGTLWTSSMVNIPENSPPRDHNGYLLARLGMCVVIPCWWILCACIASHVLRSVHGKRTNTERVEQG